MSARRLMRGQRRSVLKIAIGAKFLTGRCPTFEGIEVTRVNKKSGQRGCNAECPEWRGCKAGRLWVTGPVPCEVLLEWEVGLEYETDSLPTLGRMPIVGRVAVEAMG